MPHPAMPGRRTPLHEQIVFRFVDAGRKVAFAPLLGFRQHAWQINALGNLNLSGEPWLW